MTSYRIEIKQCSNCQCEFNSFALNSSNTFGATFYSDGYVDGSAQSDENALLICPNCDSYFWREDLTTKATISESEYFQKDSLLPNAKKFEGFHYQDMVARKLWADSNQEKYIRCRMWWSFNNDFRMNADRKFQLPEEHEANLLNLLQMLDISDADELIMKAEVLRQLGRFDECLKQIDQLDNDRYIGPINAIKKLAYQKMRHVGVIE